jgi:hypothetical protein
VGSYASLKIGEFGMGEWKSHVPLQPLLLFTQEDFRKELVKDDDGSDVYSYCFETTVAIAKHRIDMRGYDLRACRRHFDTFRVDVFHNYSFETEPEWLTKNDVSFDKFLTACKKVYKKYKALYLLQVDQKAGRNLKRMFSGEMYSDEVGYYFEDVWLLLHIRAFLEIAPDAAKVMLDLSDLVWGQRIDLDGIPDVYDRFMSTLRHRIAIDYELYGFVLEDDPIVDHRLREKIDRLDEDKFIAHILLPLFAKMGFQQPQKVKSHGRNEFGSDVRPFRFMTPLGTLEYYAVQAKCVPIHGTSKKVGNAGELCSQAFQAFNVTFMDDLDNEHKRLDKMIIATSKTISPDARRVIEESTQGVRKIIFLDIDKVIVLLRQHRLVKYVLFTPFD